MLRRFGTGDERVVAPPHLQPAGAVVHAQRRAVRGEPRLLDGRPSGRNDVRDDPSTATVTASAPSHGMSGTLHAW